MTPVVQTTISSRPKCNLPPEPQKLGPSGGRAERDDRGMETRNVIVPLVWVIDVYVIREEERAWRDAARSCLAVNQ